MITIGCHLSTSAGLKKMGETALKINANTFQFFSRNPRGGSARRLVQSDVDGLRNILNKNNFGEILMHAPYTLNMASSNPKTIEFAEMIFVDDLERLKKLPCNFYTFHPGSHSGRGVESGIKSIADIMNVGITEEIRTFVLLETMSGKGTEIGSSFSELSQIIELVNYPEKIGVCVDTCHLFSAGYDIVHDLDGVLEEFDQLLGLDRIKVVHLNDSMYPFNSKKDRHAGIGKGEIGIDAIIKFMAHPYLKHLPFILETPYDVEGHSEEIKMIREILK